MKNKKSILLKLCDELSKKEIDKNKLEQLLAQTDIPRTDSPFELTNQILKRLYPYQESQ